MKTVFKEIIEVPACYTAMQEIYFKNKENIIKFILTEYEKQEYDTYIKHLSGVFYIDNNKLFNIPIEVE